MKAIARRAEPASGSSDFNNFLFSPIGTDRFGMELSVASALARLDMDAWAEAAVLAQLPHDAAARRLAKSISRFSEIPGLEGESEKVAASLIRVLRESGGGQWRRKLARWPLQAWQSWNP